MDKFERQLEQDLKDLAEAADQPLGRERIVDRVRPPEVAANRSQARRLSLMAAVGGGVVVATLVLFNLTGVLGERDARPDSSHALGTPGTAANDDGPAGLVGIGEPCPGARHGSPSELATRTSVPVWTPKKGASDALTDGWTCSDTPVLMFDGDIQVSYEAGWSNIDVMQSFADLSKDYGGTVGELQGRPALIQKAIEPGDNNQVMLVVDDTLVRILAKDSVTIDRMINLANSLEFDSPAGE